MRTAIDIELDAQQQRTSTNENSISADTGIGEMKNVAELQHDKQTSDTPVSFMWFFSFFKSSPPIPYTSFNDRDTISMLMPWIFRVCDIGVSSVIVLWHHHLILNSIIKTVFVASYRINSFTIINIVLFSSGTCDEALKH